jgi:hypothetical protein
MWLESVDGATHVSHNVSLYNSPTGIFSCLLRRFSRAPQSTNLCFEARTRPAAAAAADFCGGLLNRLTGSRWAPPVVHGLRMPTPRLHHGPEYRYAQRDSTPR